MAIRTRWSAVAYTIAVLTAFVVAAILGSGWTFHKPSDDPWSRLVAAVGPTRPGESRISGLPFQTAAGATSSSSRSEPSPDLRLAAAQLEKELEKPTAEAYRKAAIGQLLLDNVDRSVALLEQAVARAPRDAASWNDLAAAYLVRADRGRAEDVVRALDASIRATETGGGCLECPFNLALSLERLQLVTAAAVEMGPERRERLRRPRWSDWRRCRL